MLFDFGLLVAGLVFLVFAGDFLVRGAVAVALRLGVSHILASVFIVGFGSSAPEMLVAIESTLKGAPGVATGNIIGSNIANIFLVLGIPALIMPMTTRGTGLKRAVTVTALATAAWLTATATVGLVPAVGIGFLVGLGLYILAALIFPPGGNPEELIADEVEEPFPGWVRTALFIALGVVGLPAGAHLAIEGATGLATTFGVGDELIALTLLAVGTSLPEFAASMAAAFRKQADVVLGNVAGSVMFNILAAGGIIALLGPVDLPPIFFELDHWFMGVSMGMFLLCVLSGRRMGWLTGIFFVLCYAVYMFGLNHFYLLGQGWDSVFVEADRLWSMLWNSLTQIGRS